MESQKLGHCLHSETMSRMYIAVAGQRDHNPVPPPHATSTLPAREAAL